MQVSGKEVGMFLHHNTWWHPKAMFLLLYHYIKSIFAQYPLFSLHAKMRKSTGTEHPPACDITLLISIKPCIWEEARSNLWHRLGLEEHVFPQMSGYTWQRKGSGTAPLHSCDFSQLIHFMWYWQSVTQPPIKLGGETRADGPHLMLSDCIHPSIIMQFLQMSSLRKTLHIIAHMQTLDTPITWLCHQLPPRLWSV